MKALLLIFLLITIETSSAQPIHEDYQYLINQSFKLFEPIANKEGKALIYKIEIDNPLVAGYANFDGENYILGLYGGLLQSPRLNYNSLALILCHELGHLFGGSPNRVAPPEWDGPADSDGNLLLSAEGQADYYSTAACFRKLIQGEDHMGHLQGRVISGTLIHKCKESWNQNSENYLICLRAGLAAFDFLNLVKDFDISFDKQDLTVVDRTNNGTYPSRQCRLDTMLAGALCTSNSPLHWKGLYSPCENKSHQRPTCWFKQN